MSRRSGINNHRLLDELQDFFRLSVLKNDILSVRRILRRQHENIDINDWDHRGISAIHQCAMDGHIDMMEILLKAGASLNTKDPFGWTALHAASACGHAVICRYLISRGANIMTRTLNGELAIDLAEDITITYLLGKEMVRIGYPLLAKNYLKNISESMIEMVESREKKQLRPILKTSENYTNRLHRYSSISTASTSSSVSSCDESCFEESSAIKKTKMSVQFSVGTLFRHFLKENDHENLDKLLKSVMFDGINDLDDRGLTPFHFATINGYTDVMKVLFWNGCDIDQQDQNGWSALHAAVVIGDLNLISILLRMGCNIFALTRDGQTNFDLAKDKKVILFLKDFIDNSCKQTLSRTTSI